MLTRRLPRVPVLPGLLAAVIVCALGAWSGARAADQEAPAKTDAAKARAAKAGGKKEKQEKKGKPCASTKECASEQHCTTEDGACNRPPGCGPKDICAEVCWGVCAPKKKAPSP
jgi:hypothetical protein